MTIYTENRNSPQYPGQPEGINLESYVSTQTPQNLRKICQVEVLRKLWMSITINLQFKMTSQSPTDCSNNHLQMNELITNDRNHQMKHQHDEPMIEAQRLS
jgi:hypothetical protein